MAEETQRSGTSSDRMLSVMDLFTPEQPEWTVEQACVAMGQSESTVYRYFRSLAAVGLIFSIRPGRYLLGPGIIHYERQLRLSDPLIRAAEPAVVKMAAEYAEQGLIFLSRIYRDSVMTTHEHRISAEPFPEGAFGRGRLAPLFRGAPGLALLSFLRCGPFGRSTSGSTQVTPSGLPSSGACGRFAGSATPSVWMIPTRASCTCRFP
ncbi:helix-turn-helix domain-containing protein [Streptomyces griseorubiginosus]